MHDNKKEKTYPLLPGDLSVSNSLQSLPHTSGFTNRGEEEQSRIL